MGNRRARSARGAGLTMVAVATVIATLLWSYKPTLIGLVQRWSIDPRYSHGFLVPGFAVVLLWQRRRERPRGWASVAGAWSGAGLIVSAALVQLAGARYFVPWVEASALVPALAGVALLFGGVTALRWAGPAVAFSLFMVPLPFRVEGALGRPLQASATWCSTVALQTLGLPAFAEGNVISVNNARIGVVEACNGLGMLVTFTAMTTGLALMVRRPWPESTLIVVSAAPIALAANVARITATGVLHELAGASAAGIAYHDLAGWLMMPLAVIVLGAEWMLLERVFLTGSGVAGTRKRTLATWR